MNPISRLRTRARSESGRSATDLAVQDVLALGRRVEQPEDRQQRRLAAARRPGDRDVLAALDLEVDPGERVRLDFVGEEHLRDAVEVDQRLRGQCSSSLLVVSVADRSCRQHCCRVMSSRADSNAIELVVRGHVGEDHLIAGLQPLDDLDRVHRAAAELHLGPVRFAVGATA